MGDLLPPKVRKLVDVFLGSPGSTGNDVRRAIAGRAAELSGGGAAKGEVPAALRGYVDQVALEAHRVTDADLAALRAGGYTEDQIFEITVAAALGAGTARMERGLAAVRGGR
jgi:alkylhydroperoxidase family enzyme